MQCTVQDGRRLNACRSKTPERLAVIDSEASNPEPQMRSACIHAGGIHVQIPKAEDPHFGYLTVMYHDILFIQLLRFSQAYKRDPSLRNTIIQKPEWMI